MWAIFDSIESFELWHEAIKEKMGYPIYGENAETGEVDFDNPTTDYTSPVIHKEDPRVIAWVGDENEGLEIIDKADFPEYFPSTLPWAVQN